LTHHRRFDKFPKIKIDGVFSRHLKIFFRVSTWLSSQLQKRISAHGSAAGGEFTKRLELKILALW